jgi:hypothetical protein
MPVVFGVDRREKQSELVYRRTKVDNQNDAYKSGMTRNQMSILSTALAAVNMQSPLINADQPTPGVRQAVFSSHVAAHKLRHMHSTLSGADSVTSATATGTKVKKKTSCFQRPPVLKRIVRFYSCPIVKFTNHMVSYITVTT